MKVQPIIIGIVGLPGAGKTTAAAYLSEKGFQIITLSDFIKRYVRKAGLPYSRIVLQDYGNTMRERYGPDVLADRAMKKIQEEQITKAVIDGIRNKQEVHYLQKKNCFYFVSIHALPRVRYLRVLKKRGAKQIGSYQEFIMHEKREEALGSNTTGLRVKDCMRMSQYSLANNGSKEAFYTALDSLLQRIQSSYEEKNT